MRPNFLQSGLNRLILSFLTVVCYALSTSSAHARIVDDVEINKRADGYEIRVNFRLPLRYQSHSPRDEGTDLRIQLRPADSLGLDDLELLDQLRQRETPSWNRASGIPLLEIVYEGGQPDRPNISFRFTEKVKFKVRSSSDLRSLIVRFHFEMQDTVEEGKAESPVQSLPSDLMGLPDDADPAHAPLFANASGSMLDGDYARAIQLYTKILETAAGKSKQQSQELLGVARERNGQVAHAKAEYQKYLQRFPEGPDSGRVRQRLAGLLTAAEKPQGKLRGALSDDGKLSVWRKEVYGSVAQFYFRNQTTPEGEERRVNQSELTNDVDLQARMRSENIDLRTQFSGSYSEDLRADSNHEDDEARVHTFFVEAGDERLKLRGRFGRQTRSSDGILGRFDGARLSYQLTSDITFNGILGFPVDSPRDTYIDSDRKFYGASIDLGPFWDAWDFNLFFVNQEIEGLIDRRAIGGEVRYSDATKSLFGLVDYDIFYDDLNILLFIGNWRLLTHTTINVSLDYRNNPFLMTVNAIQGQGVEELSDLFGVFSNDELFQLADDRTAKSKAVTLGITQDFLRDFQITGEISITDFEGTPASEGIESQPETGGISITEFEGAPAWGGIAAQPGAGTEYFYSTQLIKSNSFLEGDVLIFGLRYSDTQNNDIYSVSIDTRFPFSRKFRFNPKIRIDYRMSKTSNDDRLIVRPLVRMDYRIKKWMRLETEVGVELVDQDFVGLSQSSTGIFVFFGYRLNF